MSIRNDQDPAKRNKIPGLRRFVIGTLGALAVSPLAVACAPNTVNAVPEQVPSSSAPATPGESSPSASPSETESTSDSYELDLSQSEIYKNLSADDKEAVDAALKLPVGENTSGAAAAVEGEDFEHVDSDTRSLVAYILAEASPDASAAHYLEVSKDYPEFTTKEAVEAYLAIRTESFGKGDPETVAKEGAIVERSVNTVVEAAFGLALMASELDSSDPSKQAMIDNAQRMLAGTFYGVVNDKVSVDKATLKTYDDLKKRLLAVADGDKSQVYNVESDDENKLPLNADAIKVKKTERPTVNNKTEKAWFYIIDPSGKSYFSEAYPDGNVIYIASESHGGAYTWQVQGGSEKGAVNYDKAA